MGAGIAKTIKSEFPEAYIADQNTSCGDKNKLGNYSKTLIKNDCYEFVIVNAYTQYNWKGKGNKADYAAIRNVFSKLKKEYQSMRIGYPLIGAGLAGGDWDIISKIIDEELEGLDHTLVKYDSILNR